MHNPPFEDAFGIPVILFPELEARYLSVNRNRVTPAARLKGNSAEAGPVVNRFRWQCIEQVYCCRSFYCGELTGTRPDIS